MIKLLKILLGRLFKKYNELFFVGSTDILPEPLSKEEEEKYVDMFQNGDTYKLLESEILKKRLKNKKSEIIKFLEKRK